MQRRAVRIAEKKGTDEEVRKLRHVSNELAKMRKVVSHVGLFQDLDKALRPREISVMPEEIRAGLDEIHDTLVDIDRKVMDVLEMIDSETKASRNRIKQIERTTTR
jgi:hypothetical protein